jgi:hypothetical protein
VSRIIKNTAEPARCDWPEDTYIQGGSRGVVLGGEGGAYRTAFVEAFPNNTFLRGEGPTIADAEQACWQQFQALRTCPTFPEHGPWDRRHYRNGAGYCQGCGGWFPPRVTGLAELPAEPDREPHVLERLFAGDDDALDEVLTVMATADSLPEKHGDEPLG